MQARTPTHTRAQNVPRRVIDSPPHPDELAASDAAESPFAAGKPPRALLCRSWGWVGRWVALLLRRGCNSCPPDPVSEPMPLLRLGPLPPPAGQGSRPPLDQPVRQQAEQGARGPEQTPFRRLPSVGRAAWALLPALRPSFPRSNPSGASHAAAAGTDAGPTGPWSPFGGLHRRGEREEERKADGGSSGKGLRRLEPRGKFSGGGRGCVGGWVADGRMQSSPGCLCGHPELRSCRSPPPGAFLRLYVSPSLPPFFLKPGK